MTKSCFIDTNVLLYALDPANPEKQAVAAEWISLLGAREALVINPQVIAEFCHVISRKFKTVAVPQLRDMVINMQSWCLAPSTYETSVFGLELHFRTGYQVYDSFHLASAILAGCAVFLSEDMQHGHEVESLRIVNPFKSAPMAVLSAN